MTKTRAVVITGNGTNCEMEAAHACRLGGFDDTVIAHIAEILSGEIRLDDFHFLNLTGGFLDGDDLGSAKAQANRLKNATVSGGEKLLDQFTRFIEAGKLIMGVCNGFQLMVKMGMLPGLDGDYMHQSVTLTHNDCGRFQDRWTYLKVDSDSRCIFTKGIKGGIYLPVRHGEGKFLCDSEQTLARIEAGHLGVLRYSEADYVRSTQEFPANPNGSTSAIAALCDPTGRLMGLMPHPEAFVHYTQHPRWTREVLPEEGDGLILYKNAAVYARTNLV